MPANQVQASYHVFEFVSLKLGPARVSCIQEKAKLRSNLSPPQAARAFRILSHAYTHATPLYGLSNVCMFITVGPMKTLGAGMVEWGCLCTV